MKPFEGAPNLTGTNYRMVGILPTNVLIVEDDLCIQSIVIDVLNRIDSTIKVDTVTRADMAHTLIEKGNLYDLVIADVFLTGTATGLDLWRQCRTKYPQLRFIFMSSVSRAEFLREVGPNPCPPFLSKPFTVLECDQLIRNTLGLR